MYKKILITITTACLLINQLHAQGAACTPEAGKIKGVVFKDINFNGSQDNIEPGIPSIVVIARSSNGGVIDSKISGTDGSYTLNVPNGMQVRVEFENVPSYLSYAPAGTGSKTSAQFVQSPACNSNLAVGSPGQYCQNDPDIIIPQINIADPLLNGPAASVRSIARFGSAWNGHPGSVPAPPAPITLAQASQTGTTWGVAFQRSTKTFFTSAVFKRLAGLGSLGPSGVYRIQNVDGANPTVTPFFKLSDLGFSAGVDPRTLPGHPGLPNDGTLPSADPGVVTSVGKIGFGGMDLSANQKYLYLINLHDRHLYRIFIDDPARVPTVADVTRYAITNPGCSNNDYRPWAVKVHDGQVYIGVTCDAETSQNHADLKAYIQVLNESNSTFTSIFNFSLQYPRGYIHTFNPIGGTREGTWNPAYVPGVTQLANLPRSVFGYPIARLSTIDFDARGHMTISLMDMAGAIFGGRIQLLPEPYSQYSTSVMPASDLLRVCKNGSNVWSLENNGSCGGLTTAGANNNQGPGNGEYYYLDNHSTVHQDTNMGASKIHSSQDHTFVTTAAALQSWNAGMRVYNIPDAARKNTYEIYQGGVETGSKGLGLGDIQFLCDPTPMQIGNRVWNDANFNGIQDAGEACFTGVSVGLYNQSGTKITSTTTNANCEYYFNATPNTSYTVRLDNPADFAAGGVLSGFVITTANVGNDLFDSDSTLVSGTPTIATTTNTMGHSDHSLDFGLYAKECEINAQQERECNSGLPGVCSTGKQIRVCAPNYRWGEWGTCQANIQPGSRTEICNDTLDNDCNGQTDMNDTACECPAGQVQTENCQSGQPGVCANGQRTRTCTQDFKWGNWGTCQPNIQPGTQPENCSDGLDNNCNGQVDLNDPACECPAGQVQTENCQSGQPGVCANGQRTRTCAQDFKWGNWGTCQPNIQPGTQPEICNDGLDNNCNGQTDMNDTACECPPGQTESRSCQTGQPRSCANGTQTRTCQNNYRWGEYGTCNPTDDCQTESYKCADILSATCTDCIMKQLKPDCSVCLMDKSITNKLDCAACLDADPSCYPCFLAAADPSCVSCQTTDQTEKNRTVDSSFAAMSRAADSLAKVLMKQADSDADRKYAKTIRAEISQLHVQGWTLAWTMPTQIKSCAASFHCTEKSLVSTKEELVNFAARLNEIVEQLAKRLGISTKKLARTKDKYDKGSDEITTLGNESKSSKGKKNAKKDKKAEHGKKRARQLIERFYKVAGEMVDTLKQVPDKTDSCNK